MVFERPRGVRDFGPQEMGLRAYVESTLSSVFEAFAYDLVQTPLIEFLELFNLKSGEAIKEHLYVFEDKGGRKLCLRPEATASVARMYASELRNLPKPLRLYYLGPMYRYEEPQKGRYREFWQVGVELMGSSGPEADAEVVAVASESMRRLGLKYSLRISHIGVLRRLLSIQGFDEGMQDKIIQALDKGDFETVSKDVKDPSFKRILGLKGGQDSIEEARRVVEDKEIQDMLSGLEATASLLTQSNIDYTVDFSMARGLDYYTGMVFDIRVEGLGAQNQVCGGGRYDNLITLFGGPQTPAVGFAFGLDRLIESMQEQGVSMPALRTDVCVIPVSEAVCADAFRIAIELRRELGGKVVNYDLSGRKLNKALQHASELRARYAVIVGLQELKEGCVMLKDMASQRQEGQTLRAS